MCCVVLKLAIKFLLREKMMTQVRILFKEMMIRFVNLAYCESFDVFFEIKSPLINQEVFLKTTACKRERKD